MIRNKWLIEAIMLLFPAMVMAQSINEDSALVWDVYEVYDKQLRAFESIPEASLLRLVLHGEDCITIFSDCHTLRGVYRESSNGGNAYTIIIRAKMPIIENCSDDYFFESLKQMSLSFQIEEDNRELEVWIPDKIMRFTRHWTKDVFECLDRCSLEPDPGTCRALYQKYFFNQETGQCESFVWGGCGGNVPFETLEECQQHCDAE